MGQNFTTFAFTDSVKAAQERYGSRTGYARMEQAGDRFTLTEREVPFIETRDSFYMATVGENGWPYVQFLFKSKVPCIGFHLLDTGHFALEEDLHVIASHIRRFLTVQLPDTK